MATQIKTGGTITFRDSDGQMVRVLLRGATPRSIKAIREIKAREVTKLRAEAIRTGNPGWNNSADKVEASTVRAWMPHPHYAAALASACWLLDDNGKVIR